MSCANVFRTNPCPSQVLSRRTNCGGRFVVMHHKPLPDLSLLKSLLDYDPLTGLLKWKGSFRPNMVGGKVVGFIDPKSGYVKLAFERRLYRAHRIIYFMVASVDPLEWEVDHRNGIRHDNRWENLRLADRPSNLQNTNRSKTNTSGVKGVSWHKHTEKWRVTFGAGKRQIYLGVFDSKEAAESVARNYREVAHGGFHNHGERLRQPTALQLDPSSPSPVLWIAPEDYPRVT